MNTKTIIFILFGATGDLAQKKTIPALETLYNQGGFSPDSRIIAISRREWSDTDFISFTENQKKLSDGFKKIVGYTKVDIDAGVGYDTLSQKIAHIKKDIPHAEVVVYLSLAPVYHGIVVDALAHECVLVRGEVKLLIEKPFGTDEASARVLNALIMKHLNENDVYRIDHYLGKQAAQEIMGGGGFSKEIKSLQVKLCEEKGIHDRGGSYDGVGAFRDVGQNHMLEMVALILADTNHTDWQQARTLVIEKLLPPENTCSNFRRGQYEGYRDEKGVKPDSNTETAFHVETMFKGVYITLEAGKGVSMSDASIVVVYKDGSQKKYDFKTGTDAYVTVFRSAFLGLQRDFVGFNEVCSLWRYADHVQGCWDKVPLEIYSKNKPFLIP